MTWTDVLTDVGACSDAVAFGRQHKTFRAAWLACERPDWLLWWAAKCIGEPGSTAHKQLVRVACACARTALPHVKAGETRPLKAVETAEAWCDGKATLAEVRSAASAYAADAYADDAAAAYAAYAAAYAAYAADAATYAATDAAAHAAAYATYATYAAAHAAADAATYADAARNPRNRCDRRNPVSAL